MLTSMMIFNITRRKGIYLFIILICMLAACTQAPESDLGSTGNLSPETGVEPWTKAVDEAHQILNENPEFEIHIHTYLTIADEINQYLDLVEQARPALDLLNTLKNTEIPLVGNAWDSVVKALDTAYPGSGQALEIVDSGLRQILAFKGNLDSLNQLIPVANAGQAFRENPTPENLRALDRSIASEKGNLASIEQDLAEQIQNLDEYLDSIRLVQEGLSLAGTLSGIPIVGDAISSLNHSLDEILTPVQGFHGSAQELLTRIQTDLVVMDSVQEIVYQAENPESQSGDSLFPESLTSLLDDWAPILIIGLLALIILGGFLLWRSRDAKAKPARVQIPQSYPPPPAHPVEKQVVPSLSPAAVTPEIRQAQLNIIGGKMAGQSFWLTRDNMLLGRGTDCDLIVPDPAISRRHARFRYADDVWYIQDQGSTSGLLINGQMKAAARLASGDEIQIGDTALVFWVAN